LTAIAAIDGGIVLSIRVFPRSGRSAFAGERDGQLVVKLTAPPVDGAANEELIALLAKTLGVPKRAVSIVSGETSRQKRVRVDGVSIDDASVRLAIHRPT